MEAEAESPRMMACLRQRRLAQLQRVDQKKVGARCSFSKASQHRAPRGDEDVRRSISSGPRRARRRSRRPCAATPRRCARAATRVSFFESSSPSGSGRRGVEDDGRRDDRPGQRAAPHLVHARHAPEPRGRAPPPRTACRMSDCALLPSHKGVRCRVSGAGQQPNDAEHLVTSQFTLHVLLAVLVRGRRALAWRRAGACRARGCGRPCRAGCAGSRAWHGGRGRAA